MALVASMVAGIPHREVWEAVNGRGLELSRVFPQFRNGLWLNTGMFLDQIRSLDGSSFTVIPDCCL